jgi:quercetin dioxygenase-like cupin family protein
MRVSLNFEHSQRVAVALNRTCRIIDKTMLMELKRAGSQPSQKGPSEYFTGAVRIDPLTRTAWHTHPLGQTLIVTAGCGWTQCEGEVIVEIRAGDVIWCPPGHKHWHGATPTTAMTHIAIQQALDGKNVEWLEKVTDEEYRAGSTQP